MSDITLSRELALRGFHPEEVARMTRSGQLVRIRRGAYIEPPSAELNLRAQHRQLLMATARQTGADAVVSHMSAAVLHGLPIWRDRLHRVHLTRNQPGRGKIRHGVQLHGLPLAGDDVVLLDGMPVTSLARTVLDLGCQLPLDIAVAIGDAALRAGSGVDELNDHLGSAVRRHGIGSARRAVALMDARSESPEESRSRVLFHRHGIPTPELQYLVYNHRGQVIARTDFGWPELGTVGEFDGRVKYGRLLRPGQDLAEVLFDEKVREDAVRDTGLHMVRWISTDLNQPADLLQRLTRAFDRGRRPQT